MSETILITAEKLEETLMRISEKIVINLEMKYFEKNMNRELMTILQAAEYLQCSTQSVKNWTKREDAKNPLTFVRAGADPRFFKQEIDAWLKKERTKEN